MRRPSQTIFFLILIGAVQFIMAQFALAQQSLTPSQRKEMLDYALVNLNTYKDEATITTCKEQAILGDQEALSAIYVLAKNVVLVSHIAEKRQKAISEGRSKFEKGRSLKNSITDQDIKDLQRSIILIPKSTKFCENLYKKLNRG